MGIFYCMVDSSSVSDRFCPCFTFSMFRCYRNLLSFPRKMTGFLYGTFLLRTNGSGKVLGVSRLQHSLNWTKRTWWWLSHPFETYSSNLGIFPKYQLMVNWRFGLVVWIPRIPLWIYERDCYLGVSLEFQTTQPKALAENRPDQNNIWNRHQPWYRCASRVSNRPLDRWIGESKTIRLIPWCLDSLACPPSQDACGKWRFR